MEHKTYDPAQFISELKEQIATIVHDVLSDNSNRRVTILTEEDLKKKTKRKTAAKPKATTATKSAAKPGDAAGVKPGDVCPVCGKGVVIKGKTAYGCSRWKEGCSFRLPFEQ